MKPLLKKNMSSRVWYLQEDLKEILNTNLPKDRSIKEGRYWESDELFYVLVHDIALKAILFLLYLPALPRRDGTFRSSLEKGISNE